MEIEHHAHKFMPRRLGLAAASVRAAKRERGFTGILKHSRIVTTRFGHELGFFHGPCDFVDFPIASKVEQLLIGFFWKLIGFKDTSLIYLPEAI